MPDRVFTNAAIWTGDKDRPWVQAISISGDKIVQAGTSQEVVEGSGIGTEIIDLDGAFVVPGLIDSHTHFLSGGFQLASVDLRTASSREEFADRIATFAETIPEGRWILGGDWDHEAWGGELPTRDWLDDITPNNPVFITRLDGHMGLANTLAMDQAGVSKEFEDPHGGTIVRYEGARDPSGIFKDEAMQLIYAVIPNPTDDELDDALQRAIHHAHRNGVTQIHDVGSFGGWSDLWTFQRAVESDSLPLRIYSMVPVDTADRLLGFIENKGRGDQNLWWGGLKGFVDGSLGSTTAWFYDPYEDEPASSGLIVVDTLQFQNQLIEADASGLQLAIHAIGDRANDWLLSVFEKAISANDNWDRRFRIEHAQHLTSGAIKRFARLGVTASMQPYHAIDDGRWAEKRIGPERARTTYPFRSLLDSDANVSFGSDWTVAPLNPIMGIYAAVTRITLDNENPDGWIPDQKISVELALEAYTVNAAYAGFSDAFTGKLRKGFVADFVVLSDNLFEIDPVDISSVMVQRTVIGGVDRYVAN